jgi:RimJ/RimL family protein N-acetyltransferase
MTGWSPGKALELETENFRLRSLTAADATDTYISWWNDPEVQEGLGLRPRGWGRDQAIRHINKFDNRRTYHLGIFPRDQELPIGFFAIFLEPAQLARTNTVIGNKAFWGRRVVLEVRARALAFLFEDVGVEKVYGRVDGRNFSSIYNYKAQGFTCEGILRKHGRGADGTRHDLLMFGLLRDEWRKAKEQEAAE